jgi:putative RecB family exonuclease
MELLPEKISPSRLKDFMQCPRLFYYKTILGIATPQTEATARGTLAHHAFERIFDHPRGERGVNVALSYVAPAWEMMTDPLRSRADVEPDSPQWRLREANQCFLEDHEADSTGAQRLLRDAEQYRALLTTEADVTTFLESTENCVRNWYAMENPDKFDPAERELYVAAKIAGANVHGFIDRLDRIPAADGQERWYISDYKTGKPPSPRFQEEAFFQLAIYALLIEAKFKVRPHQLRLIYVREGRKDAVLTVMVDDKLLSRTKEKLRSAVKGMRSCAERADWSPRKQVLCDWCFFKDVCPAFNRELEGLLPEEVSLRLYGTPTVAADSTPG